MSERFVIQLRRGSEWARMFLRWRDQPAGPSFSGRPCAYESREDEIRPSSEVR